MCMCVHEQGASANAGQNFPTKAMNCTKKKNTDAALLTAMKSIGLGA